MNCSYQGELEFSTSSSRIQYLAREPHAYRFSSWNMVYRSLLRCFGRDRYMLGREMTDFTTDDHGVRIEFADGGTDEVELLVLADGVSSRFRQRLLPDVRPVYSGYVAWRGMTAEASLDSAIRAALLPGRGLASAGRVRQHPTRRQPRTRGVASSGWRLRRRRARSPLSPDTPSRSRSRGRDECATLVW